jgi:hypothetical protein
MQFTRYDLAPTGTSHDVKHSLDLSSSCGQYLLHQRLLNLHVNKEQTAHLLSALLHR